MYTCVLYRSDKWYVFRSISEGNSLVCKTKLTQSKLDIIKQCVTIHGIPQSLLNIRSLISYSQCYCHLFSIFN